jgi:hypothetical protein
MAKADLLCIVERCSGRDEISTGKQYIFSSYIYILLLLSTISNNICQEKDRLAPFIWVLPSKALHTLIGVASHASHHMQSLSSFKSPGVFLIKSGNSLLPKLHCMHSVLRHLLHC